MADNRSRSEDARRSAARRDPQLSLHLEGPEETRRPVAVEPPPAPAQAKAAKGGGWRGRVGSGRSRAAWLDQEPPESPRVPAAGDADLSASDAAWLKFHAENEIVARLFEGEALLRLRHELKLRRVRRAAGKKVGPVRVRGKAVYEAIKPKCALLGIHGLNNNFQPIYSRLAMRRWMLRGHLVLRKRHNEE